MTKRSLTLSQHNNKMTLKLMFIYLTEKRQNDKKSFPALGGLVSYYEPVSILAKS